MKGFLGVFLSQDISSILVCSCLPLKSSVFGSKTSGDIQYVLIEVTGKKIISAKPKGYIYEAESSVLRF